MIFTIAAALDFSPSFPVLFSLALYFHQIQPYQNLCLYLHMRALTAINKLKNRLGK